MANKKLTNRHQLHPITRQAINKAVALDVVDAVEVAVLAATLGTNDGQWLERLTGIAFNARHWDTGRNAHAQLCKLRDKYHAALAGRQDQTTAAS